MVDILSSLRYRLDGIIYTTFTTNLLWPRSETIEVEKQNIMDELLTTEELVPENMYDPREEVRKDFTMHSADKQSFVLPSVI